MRIAGCQLNPTVGAIDANCDAIIEAFNAAVADGARVVAFGELAVTGYPPEDLLFKDAFVAAAAAGLHRVATATATAPGALAIVGAVESEDGRLYNAVALCRDGEVVAFHRKRALPNYAVFDEHRWFDEGETAVPIVEVDGVSVAAVVCEDAWVDAGSVPGAASAGADVIVVVNGSPYARRRLDERLGTIGERVAESGRPIVYVNQVGGQDELIFDGGSFALDADGSMAALAPQFVEHTMLVDFDEEGELHGEISERLDDLDEVYGALVLATRDYVDKNGFGDVVVSLSGGIDSSLVVTIAADALGPERVHAVGLPSRYSSQGSVDDAAKLSANLGIDFRVIPIEQAHAAMLGMLEPHFEGRPPDLAEENLQSRIRGVIMMALSNKLGWAPVLTCGNKSESAVGYSTLYGDTAGGFAVIRDVPKLLVYALARRRNERAGTDVIPAVVLDKAPSAELRPDQRDDQSLPPYEILDPILEMYVEDNLPAHAIVTAGYDEAIVRRITSLVDRAEYKRRQTPLGPRVTDRAFGRDWRVPITNRFSG
ncbi:MAG TPA: NAD+ synthase [Acidimicrobiales bacterium]|nr:NAD+ synthase [Acidimicrobiales bacterium]